MGRGMAIGLACPPRCTVPARLCFHWNILRCLTTVNAFPALGYRTTPNWRAFLETYGCRIIGLCRFTPGPLGTLGTLGQSPTRLCPFLPPHSRGMSRSQSPSHGPLKVALNTNPPCQNNSGHTSSGWTEVKARKNAPSRSVTWNPPIPTTGTYWGPLDHLVEHPIDDSTYADSNYQCVHMQVRNNACGKRAVRMPVCLRPRCRLCATLSQSESRQAPSTSQDDVKQPLCDLAIPLGHTRPPQCGKCGTSWDKHVLDAALLMSALWRLPHARVLFLLRKWWTATTTWSQDRPPRFHQQMERDLHLAEDALHLLFVSGPPDLASSPFLGTEQQVTVDLAAKGIGPTGQVHVPSDLWTEWADPKFIQAGTKAPPQPPSKCPKVAAMLRTLCRDGLLAQTGDEANAQVFGEFKSTEKCALILNMQAFNQACKFKSRPFKLPTLEGLAIALRQYYTAPWACKIDLKNCY